MFMLVSHTRPHVKFRRLTITDSVAGHAFEPFNRTSETQAVQSLIKTWQPFRELSPKTGAYINEVWAIVVVCMSLTNC